MAMFIIKLLNYRRISFKYCQKIAIDGDWWRLECHAHRWYPFSPGVSCIFAHPQASPPRSAIRVPPADRRRAVPPPAPPENRARELPGKSENPWGSMMIIWGFPSMGVPPNGWVYKGKSPYGKKNHIMLHRVYTSQYSIIHLWAVGYDPCMIHYDTTRKMIMCNVSFLKTIHLHYMYNKPEAKMYFVCTIHRICIMYRVYETKSESG